jgi:hypothetical protein
MPQSFLFPFARAIMARGAGRSYRIKVLAAALLVALLV